MMENKEPICLLLGHMVRVTWRKGLFSLRLDKCSWSWLLKCHVIFPSNVCTNSQECWWQCPFHGTHKSMLCQVEQLVLFLALWGTFTPISMMAVGRSSYCPASSLPFAATFLNDSHSNRSGLHLIVTLWVSLLSPWCDKVFRDHSSGLRSKSF